MNKSLFWKKNKLINKFQNLQKKYKFKIELVDNLTANACIINFDKEFLIFINKNISKNLVPLVILHEIGHIKFKTLSNNPKKYSYLKETTANLYAIYNLLYLFNIKEKLKLVYLTIKSEKELYKFFNKKNYLGGNFIYEHLLNN